MPKKKYWSRREIRELKQLINIKTNEELTQIFNCTIGTLQHAFKKYHIKRDITIIHEMQYPTGERAHNWKGGISKNHYHYKKKQVERYPEKVRAHSAVYQAIKDGRLIKPNKCENCGNINNDLHFHHTHGYSHEHYFTGKWLCRSCHIQEHKNKERTEE